MANSVIPVFFSVDDNYAHCLAVAVSSLIANADKNVFLKIYILNEGLSEPNKAKISSLAKENAEISFTDVTDKVKRFGNSLHLREPYTKATYYRFFIPELFTEYDKAIYLDSDILVLGDINKLYSIDTEHNLIAAARDDTSVRSDIFGDYVEKVVGVKRNLYFNAGVMVMDLAALRDIRLEKSLASVLYCGKFPVAQDQDYLNFICKDRVFYIPNAWNVTSRIGEAETEAEIVHFKITAKPWKYNVPYSDKFWEYAKQTPFYSELRENFLNYGEADIQKDKDRELFLKKLCEKEIARRALA